LIKYIDGLLINNENKTKMKTFKITISGTVQGVTFRQFIESKANELGIRGFVRNLEDGRVEVVAEGKDENVNEMVSICKKGPAHADIKNVDVEELRYQGFEKFKISML